MLKRILLFALTNIAIIALLIITTSIISAVFWIEISWHTWGYLGMFIYAMLVWFIWSFISLALSKWLAKKSYNINLFSKENLHSLTWKERLIYETIEEISSNNNITIPEIWIYEDSEPNAFATWMTKNSSLVAVSTWLLNWMNEDQIKWVVAHEMAHILNWDMVTMGLIQWVLNTFVVFIANILTNLIDTFLWWDEEEQWLWFFARLWINIFFQILLWLIASLILMWFSRIREYGADEWSAKYVWKEKMISALEALKDMKNLMTTSDDWKLATMKIWTKEKLSLFSSHPSLESRIQSLRNNPNL